MKSFIKILLGISIFAPLSVLAAGLNVSLEKPIQGEPILISISGLSATKSVSAIYFEGKKLGIFTWKGKPSALYGIDLYKTPGTYAITAKLSNGESLKKEIKVGQRKRLEEALGIPEKLGGNTKKSADTLVSTLAAENASLLGLRTGDHAFWKEPFRYPVAKPVVTDEYGYQRQTGGYSIAHKGVDFKASEGTPVMAMNRGVVRLARFGRNYGNTIVLDHGLGLQTFYMHLSKIKVKEGELVLPGQVIGLSGETGYAEKPHLHITVRVNETSIDPMVFLGMLK